MKILADENVPFSIIQKLEEKGYDIRWIQKDAPDISDILVMQRAYQDTRAILTFDPDFGELCIKERVQPFGRIILLRLYQMSLHDMAEYTTNIISTRDDWEGHFSVLENDRERIRTLPQ
ncbi:MAG: DUF5615 family PIN-like protein [Methanospirillaceae archaeon]|nr:DUF5615 family PIN-like protein [Methanospirillaceae archaeon]